MAFFFLVPNAFGQQKVEQYNSNGLSTNIFNLASGKITVYVPFHAKGETISGTIRVEALGDSDKQRKKNLSKIQNYLLVMGEVYVSVNASNFKIPSSVLLNSSVQLLNDKGKVLSNSYSIKERKKSFKLSPTKIPAYVVSGQTGKIIANTDGDLTNNSIIISNKNASILAETESELFFEAPSELIGENELRFTNEGDQVVTDIHVLDMQLSVDKLDLFKGESTNLSIGLSGLEGLEYDVPLTITNTTPRNIILEGGNFQELEIDPEIDASEGTYRITRSIKAKVNGSFSISVNVPPTEFTIIESDDELLCNCYLNGQTYLISPEACNALGGNCSEHISDDEVDDEIEGSPPSFLCDIPDEITENEAPVTLQLKDYNATECIAVMFSYRPIGEEEWQLIGTDNSYEDGLSVNWSPPIGEDGPVEVLTQVVNKNDVTTQSAQFVYLRMTPKTLNGDELNMSFSISNDDIRRALERARAINDGIRKEQDKIEELLRKWWEAHDRKTENEKRRNELVEIDEVLDEVPGVYKDSLKAIIDSLSNLKKQLPVKIDTTALNKAVDDAQKRLDDCKKRLEELKKEQADLEAERDRLKEELDATLKEIDDLYTRNGWKGGYGYHADGRPWYGYIGNDRANVDLGDEKYELRKQYKALKKAYLKSLNRLKQLPDEIAEAADECDELNAALEKAKNAADKGDQYVAAEVEADDLCRQIKSLLRKLLRWCNRNTEDCTFGKKIVKLLEECPKTSAALKEFWDDFDDLIKAKKEQEKAYGDEAEDNQAEMDGIDGEIKNVEDRIKALKEQQAREYAEAERLRKQRAQEIENERKRKRDAAERKKAEAKKKEAKPEPYLKEPVDPSDDQLKAQANSWVFKRLYYEYLISKGPCDCTAMALKFANNSNTIWSDLVGRIGVGVAFAPLEAFPGVSLAGRLGIGAAKALCSHLFGGQSFSEELTKNLFNVIGGEIFPKLVGNDFTGNRMNDLAGKGLDEILEAEGARAISWDGKVDMGDCGEVSGNTTMLINPKTGWVTVLIKIDDCPLVVVKYKVNKDGIPTNKPTVTTVKG
jgi:peptidoglycan hydrolase CwlO-like protein